MNSEKNMHKTEKFSKFLLQKINLSYNIQFKKLKPLGRVVNLKKNHFAVAERQLIKNMW